MEVSAFMGGAFLTFVYLMIGFFCTEVWKDAIKDIASRTFRVPVRFAMLLLWPFWLAFWAICVVIALIGMALWELCQ